MAAKRLRDGPNDDSDKPEEKRFRRLPSFSTVIREVVMVKQLQNLAAVLEPLIRRVVREEVEGVVNGVNSTRLLPRPPPMQIEAADVPYLQLAFRKPPSLPIFTGSRIEDVEGSPLQIVLIDTRNEGNPVAGLGVPLRLEVVVLDGDFPSEGHENWTSDEFNRGIVRERTGRRPLLTGDIQVMLREGVASIGELNFTDNSSWIRSQHFRIAVRIAPGSYEGPRIKEAMTEAFRVKDHRGELYKKHYPPALTDEVWRLEKIGKDGAFHNRLSAENINTVQDFLKLWAVDSAQLRRILGVGMSDRIWEGTIGHAKTCITGEKLYAYRKQSCTVFLNSICEVIAIEIDGMPYSPEGLNTSQKAYVQEMVREAYRHWNMLEESDGMPLNTSLLQSSKQYPSNSVQQQSNVYAFYDSNDFDHLADESVLPGAIEASTSWYIGQHENPDFEIEEFDQVGTVTRTIQWSHRNNFFG